MGALCKQMFVKILYIKEKKRKDVGLGLCKYGGCGQFNRML